MKIKKLPMPERLFIALGLLLVVTPTLINDWFPMPDVIRGFLVGAGLGMEIMGLIKLRRRGKAEPGV